VNTAELDEDTLPDTEAEAVRVTLNRDKPFSENRGDMQPDDPHYLVAFWQGDYVRVLDRRTKRPTKAMVLLPFDAQGELVPDDGKKEPWQGKDSDGKPVTHYPLWNDNMRALHEKKLKELARRKEEGEDEPESDLNWTSGRVNWLGWLTGTQKYTWPVLVVAGKKTFNMDYTSKRQLVEDLVKERGLVKPERLAPDLAKLIGTELAA
jgi:hypothetical protein